MGKKSYTLPYNVNLVRPDLAGKLIIIFCIITLVFSVFNLVIHCSFRELRINSGSTILYILISELIFIICFMFSAIFFQDFK